MQYVCFHSTVTSLSVSMILYAKSSLELIVNNRIGKVGIRTPRAPFAYVVVPLSHSKPTASVCLSFAHVSVCPSVSGFWAYTLGHIHVLYTHIYKYFYMYIFTNIHSYINIYLYIYSHMCLYFYIFFSTHVRVWIRGDIRYMRAQTHILHVYIYVLLRINA